MCQFLPEVVQESLSHLGKQSLCSHQAQAPAGVQLWLWKALGQGRDLARVTFGERVGFQVLGALFFQG